MSKGIDMYIADMWKERCIKWERNYDELNDRWNALVARINAKGGEDFLKDGKIGGDETLTVKQLRELRILCHPDKHHNSPKATAMTQTLNAMIRKAEKK